MAENAFRDVEVYGHSVLACSRLKYIYKELLSSVKDLYEGKDVFLWLPARFGNSICYQILPFVSDYKLGPILSGKGIGGLVISPMVSLIVDHV